MINELKKMMSTIEENVSNIETKLIKLPKDPLFGIEPVIPPPSPELMQDIIDSLYGVELSLMEVENSIKNINDPITKDIQFRAIHLKERICSLKRGLPRLPTDPFVGQQRPLLPLPNQVQEINKVLQLIKDFCNYFEEKISSIELKMKSERSESEIEGVTFEVIIPKHRNDKTPISKDRIFQYKNEIVEFAGGLTEIDTRGLWIGSTKQLDFDENLTIQVFVPKLEEERTAKYLKLLCKQMAEEFGQELIMLKKQGSTVDFIEGKREQSTIKKEKKDRLMMKKELQHFILKLLEESQEELMHYIDLLSLIAINVQRYGIDLDVVDRKRELNYLIEMGYIRSKPAKRKFRLLFDDSRFVVKDDPLLTITNKGREFYFNADVKCKLQE